MDADTDSSAMDQWSLAPFPALAESFVLSATISSGECSDAWELSIQSNNSAIHCFLDGRLIQAHQLLLQSSRLQHQSFYDERNGAQEYRCKWVEGNLAASLANSSVMTLSGEQTRLVSHIFMRFLIIDYEDIGNPHDIPHTAPMPPDVFLCKLDWAVNYNLALMTQILGLLAPSTAAMTHRAASFELYEQVSLDMVDWFNDDGYAPVSVAILIMAIYNNQGAMYCQLDVRLQIEKYWKHLRRIWNESAHLLKGKTYSQIFQNNLRWLEATDTRTAGAA